MLLGRAGLAQLRDRFSRGVPPGEQLSVKVPFEIDGGGGRERTWVVVDSWDAAKIHGTLNNDPTAIKRLRAGAHLDVEPGDVTDYAWYKKDGSFEGGERSTFSPSATNLESLRPTIALAC